VVVVVNAWEVDAVGGGVVVVEALLVVVEIVTLVEEDGEQATVSDTIAKPMNQIHHRGIWHLSPNIISDRDGPDNPLCASAYPAIWAARFIVHLPIRWVVRLILEWIP
jgi:hypothetical protein